MHITIRRYKTDSPKEVTPTVNERFFPLISNVAGLVAYYGIEISEDGWLSISVFEPAVRVTIQPALAAWLAPCAANRNRNPVLQRPNRA